MTKLPPFVVLIEPEKQHRISKITKGNDVLYIIDTVSGITFDIPSKAYDYVTRVLSGTPVFEVEELSAHGKGKEGFFFESVTNRMIFSYTKEEKLKSLEYHYQGFLEIAKDYEDNPEDWCNAYLFVQEHPALWNRKSDFPDSWITDGGWKDAWISVWKDKGIPKVLIEHGSYLPEELKDGSIISNCIPSHDTRMDVCADDYHTAVVAFAKALNDVHNLDGTEKNA